VHENRLALKEQEPAINDFIAKLEDRWKSDSFVCVGLDTEFAKLPEAFRQYTSKADAVARLNRDIVDATHDLVCAYKLNAAF
jgi:orotidine-5'-phosphate decarboxylase